MTHDRTESLLRAALERDAGRVPLPRPEWDDVVRLRRHPAPPPRRWPATLAAVLFVGFVGLGIALSAAQGGSRPDAAADSRGDLARTTFATQEVPTTLSSAQTSAPATTAASSSSAPTTVPARSTTSVPPPVTLAPPQGAGTPVTVPAGPPSYYRVAPDLDLGWVGTGEEAQICWRTPAVEDCTAVPLPPSGPGGSGALLAVPSSAGHTVVLVLDVPGSAAAVVGTGADGTPLASPITWDDQVDVGIARFDLAVSEVSDLALR